MSLCRDKQIKGFLLFLCLFALLFVGTGTVLTFHQVNDVEILWLTHDEAVVSSLLEQGVPKEVIAVAFTNTDISEDGRSLLAAAGLGKQSESSMRPYFNQFLQSTFCMMLCTVLILLVVLAMGIFVFLRKRQRLYQQADKVLTNYINGDYSCHLPQNYEGGIFQIFSSVEQLATMLQSKNETEHKAKEFLKDTISDISHQLKTPLSALAMYQEIIENEPDNVGTVKQFAAKMGISLKRMEQLILSMLKITRLDMGNIIFEKNKCYVSELISHSINELTTRAKNENKQIQVDGDGEQQLICDMAWTSEAIGNIVKNALDHTQTGGIVRITWERTLAMFRILISDNGTGIALEDIHHIFKRFYRSKHSLDTQGIGLGLPLAKSIIEGQGGVISVQSEIGNGTTFTLSFLTEL
ncbi:sensor histidine kinase [Evtepia gabavorous]|uniref:sensor histidine kinase n=1 Tax=Evtepia gabavorous TaxID=2211183 RepID=UPI003A8DB367